MFYISAPELDHLQIRWPVLRSEGDKSRNWVFQNLFDNCVEYFTKKHLWQNRRKHLACLEAWFHKKVVDMRPGLFTPILVTYLPTFEVNFMLKLFSFPLILKSIHKQIFCLFVLNLQASMKNILGFPTKTWISQTWDKVCSSSTIRTCPKTY